MLPSRITVVCCLSSAISACASANMSADNASSDGRCSQCDAIVDEATSTFRFFAHPAVFRTDGVLSEHYARLYDAVMAHPARTLKLEEADCVFLGVDVACDGNWPHSNDESSNNFVHFARGSGDGGDDCRASRLSRLDKYLQTVGTLTDTGLSHVIFDMSSTVTHTAEPIRRHPSVIMASPGHDVHSYREGVDVAFPALPRFDPPFVATAMDPLSCDSSVWQHLLVFRGALSSPTRESVAELHDGKEIVVQLLGGEPPMTASLVPGETDVEALGQAEIDYLSLLRQSRFALAPRGEHAFSRGVVEAACMGTVPVILSDRLVLPFSEAGGANYDTFSVRVAEDRWFEIPSFLKNFSDDAVCQMQVAAREACDRHFRSFGAQVATLMEILARRVPGRSPATFTQTEATPTPEWAVGPWLTFGCGERIRASSAQERQRCSRCLDAGHGRGLPVCADAFVKVPLETSHMELRELFNVGRRCAKRGGEHDGCECVQTGSVTSADFAHWKLSPLCEVQHFERIFDCGPVGAASQTGGALQPCDGQRTFMSSTVTPAPPLACVAKPDTLDLVEGLILSGFVLCS
eukprot:TRINITY_DN36512_c0_g1_i1.p1 TRINITY_DN36512_c0_g1~~TRINITY_DN36512_c0_g1_i1.p1  ORF type:complete len:577 (+),score=80.56 TRINITY_DN36512_c0_g1_i1:302-2032(+)